MNKKIIAIILAIVIIAGVSGTVAYHSLFMPASTEKPIPPTPTPPLLYNEANFPQYMNASQGTTQQLNLTLTSMCSSEIAIPIENLTINGYTSIINYDFAGGSPWNTSVQQTVFNYSFSLSQLILQPFMSNSTIITINLADNAAFGSYSLEIHYGNVMFLSAPKQYDISYSGSTSLVMRVAPNETP